MEPTLNDALSRIDTVWVLVAGILVFFMQAGFLLLEVGFSRMKNAGTIVAKVIANLSIAALCYWAVGFALAFGGTGWFAGTEGSFLGTIDQSAFPAMEFSAAAVPAKFFFQFAFCAVSLAIIWGTTLERIKFGAYLIYAVVFSALIYPVISHWIFGGGWLQASFGMQDFAGLDRDPPDRRHRRAGRAAAAGPAPGQVRQDGSPNVIPGHSMPLMGLGVLILFVGWFGFNAGSTLGVADGRFAEVAIVTVIGAAGGCSGRWLTSYAKTKTIDIGMIGNGVIAGLVAITAPSGYVEYWAAVPIGLVAGRARGGLHHRDRQARGRPDRRALRPRRGRRLGDAGLRAVHRAAARRVQRDRRGRAVLHRVVRAARRPGARRGRGVRLGVRGLLLVFYLIKSTYGLRVTAEEERRGLDIVEHGMWGYPEQFMPVPGSEYHPPNTPGARAGALGDVALRTDPGGLRR